MGTDAISKLLAKYRVLIPWWPFGLAILLVVILILNTPSAPYSGSESFVEGNQKPSRTSQTPTFIDTTLSSGLAFSHLQGDKKLTGLNETLGTGACAFDYDNDGWIDLFLVNGSGQTRFYGSQYWWHLPKGNALFRNLGNGKFENVTTKAGLKAQVWGMGCVSADLDNDGDSDLLVTTIGHNILYRNNGNGSFADVTTQSGIAGKRWSTSATVADYDGDGQLDIYIANYIDYRKGAYTYEPGSQFTGGTSQAFDPALYDAQANRLYRNLGGMQFEDTSRAANVENKHGRSLGVVWLDANDDTYPDLFVANDKGAPNELFVNQGNGKFIPAGAASRVSTALGSMGVSHGDTDNDGDIDVVVGSDTGHAPLLLINGESSESSTSGTNTQEIKFSDLARARGIGGEETIEYSGWSPGLHDFNNDGWLDLFMANGLATPDPDTGKIPQGQQKQLWINKRDGSYREVSRQAGAPLLDTQSARGASFADFDNDGDMDIYVAHNNGLGQFLVNSDKGNNWLGIKLVGTKSNRDAIGTKVTVHTAATKQQRTVSSGDGALSDSDRRLHFGLGATNKIERLEVRWPNGRIQTFDDIPISNYLLITEGDSDFALISTQKQSGINKPDFNLKISINDATKRGLYLEWLAASSGIESALPELETGLQDKDPAARYSVIELLKAHPHPGSLALLVRALTDESIKNRVAVVRAIRAYESETSIRWLLRMFRDPAAEVRIATADAFAFFYREEEAVVHRKYLAIPYLIRLLQDNDSEVRQAAARALGDAERYRGVQPLLAALGDPEASVRAEVARALGLIRERESIPALRKLVNEANQPPLVRAQGLIALKRLNYNNTDRLLRDLLSKSKNTRDLKPGLQTIKAIMNDEDDGIVFNRKQLIDVIALRVQKLQAEKVYSPLSIEIIDTLAASHSLEAVRPLQPYTRHPDAAVRKASYGALIRVNSTRAKTYLVEALGDSSADLRASMLGLAQSKNIKLPATLLLKQLAYTQTRVGAIKLLEHHPTRSTVQRMYSIATSSQEKSTVRLAALNSLTTIGIKKPALNRKIFQHSDEKLRLAALEYWASRQPRFITANNPPPTIAQGLTDSSITVRLGTIDFLLTRPEAWAKRSLRQSAQDSNKDLALRLHIIDGLAADGSRSAIQTLEALTRLRHDAISRIAMEKLAGLHSKQTDSMMWTILKNKQESDEFRFLAAEALQPRHTKAVLLILQSG